MPYKYVVAAVFIIGLFMDLLDMTITNVALPTFSQEFDAGPTTIEWVVTAYLLSLAVFIPVSGWAGDRFGTKATFMFALSVFVLGSILSAASQSIGQLIAFRIVQGIGGGMLTPVGTAMLFRSFPPAERAKAAAIMTIPIAVAPATGPVLGGYLVEYHSWRWIFLINIPFGIAGLLIAAALLREERQQHPGRLDVPGFLLSGIGLAALVYALAEAGSRGFGDSRILAFGLGGLALLAVFVLIELRTPEPMIDVRLLRNRLFAAANAVQLAGMAGFIGALFLLPLFLQAEKGLSPLESGLATFPQAIGVMSAIGLASRIYRIIGPRRMLVISGTALTVTTMAFLLVDLETNVWWVRLLMLTRGWAMAFQIVALQTATFATIPLPSMGRASAIFNVDRQVAGSLGVAVLTTALANRLGHHDAVLGDPATREAAVLAFHDAFALASVFGVVTAVAALLISDKEAAGTMRQRHVIPELAAEGIT